MYFPHTGMRTPFVGIGIKPYRDDPEFAKFLSQMIPARGKDFYIWNDLKKAIYEGWMEDKIHVIGSSSGYDSRIIAKVLQELREEKGDKWFGETYFVECGGESMNFLKVMKALGWTEKNYIVWEPNYDFDYFMNISDRFNGLCAYPVNQWYDYYAENWNQEDIQYISGYGGNVSDAMRNNGQFLKPIKNNLNIHRRLRLFFKWNYDYQLAAFKQPKYSFHPFWTWDYIRSVAGFDHREPKTSMYLCKHFVPECSHIRRMTINGDVAGLGYRTIKSGELKKMYEWFKSTRYGSVSKIKPNPTIEYNQWWLEYCIASYVEKNNIDLR